MSSGQPVSATLNAAVAPAENVFYYQLTLGPAHVARIRALDRIEGFRCRGVALAAKEETRRFDAPVDSDVEIDCITTGTYESLARGTVLRAAKQHVRSLEPTILLIDSPADPVQYRLGRWAQRQGMLVMTRWAATWLDHPRFAWKEFLKGFRYRRWDAYLVTGERANDYLARFGVPADRAFVCGNPVDVREIDRLQSEAPERESSATLFFAGRFLRLKNLVPFLNAFATYRRQGGRLGLRLAGFGEVESEVRRVADKTPGVELLGHLQLPELVREYASCAALVLPSYSENWGLVVNEAMQTGAPILASTHVGCVPELVHDGQTGTLFDPLDCDSMVEALHRFDRLSEQERRAMSAAARSVIADHTPERWATCVAMAARAVRSRAR